MKRKIAAAGALIVSATLVLTACSSGTSSEASGPATLTVSGWSLQTTPEFQVLADGFHEKYPDVTVELKEYDPAEYNTLVTADLAAGSGPDIITQKEVKYVTTFKEGGQLLDVSDIELPDGISGTESYEIDGSAYAVPYRQDSWVLYYDKTLFDTAGVAYPDGSWTWDDYADAAEALKAGLTAAGNTAYGAYLHRWQSTVQGFASAQAPDADILSGEFDYLEPYYDRTLSLQDDKAQVDFNTITANQLGYGSEFGTQKAAMMLMGTWYVGSLTAQQASGEAQDFDWGIAPAPQYDESTTGLDETPVTFGDPTGFGINANIDDSKTQAAKDFLAYAASADAAERLAEIAITPALLDDEVAETFFATPGVPTDELSRFAVSTHDTKPENPTSSKTAAVQTILGDLHTGVMSGSESVSDAVSTAQDRVASEVGTD
ncbi:MULTISPECIES: ABC transporter substrate-binding protein [unclassified Rathayibacter]|uniref:ABC transporter substrate-binding protein n=1 Tax=unclassified Rathayibacter TaxID=2609250 RepID=UPI0006FFA9C2|nr:MULTISPECIES: extracellular solute-binding protein [unclassified Rathayibacter]KQQ05536.1 sugar ABC transporter substrate-binding protein [Rathayibacter sp. Leaf294]KQS13399.1 sugar ABC transporter substrate-binding protein [Rathayibacter sp. Leaf185]